MSLLTVIAQLTLEETMNVPLQTTFLFLNSLEKMKPFQDLRGGFVTLLLKYLNPIYLKGHTR